LFQSKPFLFWTMVDSLVNNKEGNCLNCGTIESGKYCSNCGQKFQPTKVPLKLFLEDAVETLFNIDNRWLKTLKHLFINPGKVTIEYIEGKRAQYLPPLRVYLSISILYFLVITLVDSNQIFFINFSDSEENVGDLATIIQSLLFFLVPVFAILTSILYRKRKAFYVEYLILSLHIHTVWFVLLMIELFTVWLDGNNEQQWAKITATILSAPAQLGTLIYVVLYFKKMFNESWIKTIAKSLGLMVLYILSLVSIVAIYFIIILDWFS